MRRALALALILTACSRGPAPSEESRRPSPTRPATVVSVDVVWRDAAGTLLCTLRPHDDGFKIRDAQGAELGKVKATEDRVKLKDAGDVERWKIKRKNYGAEIEDGTGRRLFRIRSNADGEWKLADADDATVVKCKPKADGFEVRDAHDATLAKVKPRAGKLVFESEDGARKGELEGATNPRAGMWFALERLTLAERAALFAYFEKVQR
jgi:hypothetical protein